MYVAITNKVKKQITQSKPMDQWPGLPQVNSIYLVSNMELTELHAYDAVEVTLMHVKQVPHAHANFMSNILTTSLLNYWLKCINH